MTNVIQTHYRRAGIDCNEQGSPEFYSQAYPRAGHENANPNAKDRFAYGVKLASGSWRLELQALPGPASELGGKCSELEDAGKIGTATEA